MNEKELKQKLLEYQILQTRLEALLKQKNIIIQRIAEAETVLKSISTLKNGDEIIFSIGFNSYSKARLNSEKFLIEIGSNILLEKSKDEALKLLSERKVELEKSLKQIENEIVVMSKRIQKLNEEISKSEKNVQLS